MFSVAELKSVAVEGLMLAAIASMLWLPLMRKVMQRAVTAGTISAEQGRATFERVSAVPFVIALAIVFALLTMDLVLPAPVRVLGYVVAVTAVAVSVALRRAAPRIG
jgi:hypothetical protein